ncbi:flotillin family protein, partial [bacterium]|nr:flotillin family protein [bacterium]
DADRDVAMAEAKKRSNAAEMVQTAKAKEEGYEAEKLAELKRAQREMATKEADQIVPAQIAKREVVIAAEADKEKAVLEGMAKGEATQAEMEGHAAGMKAILEKQAEGFRALVESALSDPAKAIQFLIANNLEKLMAIQVEAIKNIKIDKVTVWDTGCSADGTPTTANFLSGMVKSIPTLNDLFKMAGMELPTWMGQVVKETKNVDREKADLQPSPDAESKEKQNKDFE